jgi:site-specific DNA recombinase
MRARGKYEYFYCLGRHKGTASCMMPYFPVAEVEAAVERYYRGMRLAPAYVEKVREDVRAELDTRRERAQPELEQARSRVQELEQERRRAARGVVTGTVPDDIAIEEQDRIAAELKQAQRLMAAAEVAYATIEANLNRVLELAGRCDEIYRLGGPHVRRLANQCFFRKVLVAMEGETVQVAEAILQGPWDALLIDSSAQNAVSNTKKPAQDFLGRGSYADHVVGAAGFEPATPRL